MKKRSKASAAWAAYLSVSLAAVPAHAAMPVAAPATDALLSTSITKLTELVAQQIDSSLTLSSILTKAAHALTVANHTLGVTRQMARVVQLIKNYSWEELRDDMRRGLYRAMPELQQIEDEWRALKANGAALQGGRFWSHRDHHDVMSDQAFANTARLALEGSVFPVVAPDIWEEPMFRDPGEGEGTPAEIYAGEVERLLEYRYSRFGMLDRVARQRLSFAGMARKLQVVVDEAEANTNAELFAESVSATSAHQTAVNTTELVNQKLLDSAEKERLRQAHEELEKNVVDAIEIDWFSTGEHGVAP